MNIAIIEGGWSDEKAISLKSAQTVYQHLSGSEHQCYLVRIDQQGWQAHYQQQFYPIDKNDFSFQLSSKQKITFDFAFIMIHGAPGEDGTLQAYFDLIGIPYSTAGQLASALSFHKFYCNRFLAEQGFSVAPSIQLSKPEYAAKHFSCEQILKKIPLPCFVKPCEGGSSFGVSLVKNERELLPAIEKALSCSQQCMIEQQIVGIELSNGIYQTSDGLINLPITEIVSDHEYFDYAAKYQGASQEITPARISEQLNRKIQHLTQAIYQSLQLSGICRIDYILSEQEVIFLEVNTVPGFSAESIVPQMADCAGIDLKDMLLQTIAVQLTSNQPSKSR